VTASAGAKQFDIQYPNTTIENGRLDFPKGTYLVLGPQCQGIVFRSCTLSGAVAAAVCIGCTILQMHEFLRVFAWVCGSEQNFFRIAMD
jgi:hypothetical protein